MKPQNLEEKIVWYYITGTYGLYFLGLQYILAPAIAWILTLYVCKKLWDQTEDTPESEKITIPLGVWVWIISMLTIEVALIAGHFEFNLGLGQLIKSTVSFFMRTWALLALFPLIGCLKIRPQLIYRAVCILCLQSLVFIFIGYVASKVHIAAPLYTPPLSKIGGGGQLYYDVYLYYTDPWEHETRLYLFAPWAPALGLVGSLYFFLTYQETEKKWRFIGMIGAAAMAWVSASRTARLCLLGVPILTWFLANITRPHVQIATGVGSVLAGLFGPQASDFAKNLKENFDNERASSSAMRHKLVDIAYYRWWNEAPIWGHGLAENGPQIVQFRPIGSHHTWIGILFIHGVVGFIALAVPMLWSFVEFIIKAPKIKAARAGLSIILVLFFYSFGETIDTLAYLYWPALTLMGIAFKEEIPYYNEE